MQGLILAVAVILVCPILYLKPRRAIAIYFIQLLWFPTYLRISVGSADISVSRIVILALVCRCLMSSQLRNKFRKSPLDNWMLGAIAVYVFVYMLTHAFGKFVESQSGFIMDSWCVYFSTRYCIRCREDLITVLKSVTLALIPLAVVSAYESTTAHYLFYWLRQYCPWDQGLVDYPSRWGLTRAWGPFSHTIMFGSVFGMFVPLVWILRKESGRWGKITPWLTLIVAAGGFFTISSSVLGMLIVMAFAAVLERRPRLVKPILISAISGCIIFEIFGSVPFYRWLLAKSAVGGGGWVWRSKLIECALRDFPKWWLLGYKGVDPGWGAEGFLQFTDLTNEFIAYGVYYGVWGVIALVAILTVAFKIVISRYKLSQSEQCRSLYWGLGIFLVGLISLWTGVSFFGAPTMFFYGIMGMIGSSAHFTENKRFATTSYRKTNQYPIHKGTLSC